MEKNNELLFNTKRVIKSSNLSGNIYLYRDEVYMDEHLYSVKEGIAESEDLDVKYLDPIKSKKYYRLLRNEFLEHWHTDIMAIDYFDKNSTHYPYSDYRKNPAIYVPVLYDSYFGTLSALDGTLYPKARFFDHTMAFIDNFEFDLDCLEEFLRKFPDRFHDVKRSPIPYYNADEKHTEQISFVWVPTSGEYAEYISKSAEACGISERIAITIMGLDQFRISHEND